MNIERRHTFCVWWWCWLCHGLIHTYHFFSVENYPKGLSWIALTLESCNIITCQPTSTYVTCEKHTELSKQKMGSRFRNRNRIQKPENPNIEMRSNKYHHTLANNNEINDIKIERVGIRRWAHVLPQKGIVITMNGKNFCYSLPQRNTNQHIQMERYSTIYS